MAPAIDASTVTMPASSGESCLLAARCAAAAELAADDNDEEEDGTAEMPLGETAGGYFSRICDQAGQYDSRQAGNGIRQAKRTAQHAQHGSEREGARACVLM